MTADGCDLLCLDLPRAQTVRAALPEARVSRARATTAQAFADPMRVRTASALAIGGELCVCDLAWIVGAAPNLVSHHLRILRRAGLVASRRQGKLVMCRLTTHGATLLETLSTWSEGDMSSPRTEASPMLVGGQEHSDGAALSPTDPAVRALTVIHGG
ncbi:ArsR/SmtB family transcription factor [Actinotalea solisilvae]|uniref:ArsR/SmtB family transcription factor n=1 Tax=Actinotalea solisilvae TaxID=2072922 RepID=UPI0018F10F39|nr:metalloregulator ArsR/SmtB family transcription factor [Actinotalea solisilvae]